MMLLFVLCNLSLLRSKSEPSPPPNYHPSTILVSPLYHPCITPVSNQILSRFFGHLFQLFYLQKTTPKFHPVFWIILTPKMVPQSLPKWSQNRHRIHYFFAFVFPPFFLQFLDVFFSIVGVLNPRFCCYLQCFREVRHFSQSRKKYQKRPPKNAQNNTKNVARGIQKCIRKWNQKITWKLSDFGSQNGPKMKPNAHH